ncbi:4helix_suffix domain protein [Citrifermentans bemidjiense Bem]|uniref:4helix_suffix domain protein n=1 Tax=Citrifermentans bemidjiense (strain ATCC BAA-1014 / DSM 16622 / JCM 12645 / Bem) TaxID=404380 RepID=B5E9V2_CITBB|nr:four helix bundle suffix domain-containing protein [Citrifermentans bemidjiense]ACH37250.1 4helix_suffix domain protein [Citrifermentans bemidjiense Bem]
MENEALIPAHGGYRNLKSFQVAQLAYDVTVRFCDRYIGKSSRTHDQMVQAARSGVQNIAEGSQASGTSKKTEMKLTSVARASLEELRLDYQDFLRQRGLPLWDRSDPRRLALITRRCRTADEVARWVVETRNGHNGLSGRCGHGPDGPDGPDGPCAATESIKSTGSIGSRSIESTRSTGTARSGYAEVAANAALTLIAVACSLLERQLAAQAAAFQKEGGFTERLYRTRTSSRKNP